MSKENKNEVVKMDVEPEVQTAVAEVTEEKKIKTVGKKVGKILLGTAAIVGAFILGAKVGGRSNGDDYEDDIIIEDSYVEDDDE